MKAKEREQLLGSLESRFAKNMRRHKGITWEHVLARLEGNPLALKSLGEMEASGGEPDVIGQDKATGQCIFCDCSSESPSGRRSLCYDREALHSRKEHKPEGSAVEMAAAMGIELLTEEQYRELQQLDEFDTKTSSWIVTPGTCAHAAVLSFAIDAMVGYSCITTERSRTTQHEASAGGYAYDESACLGRRQPPPVRTGGRNP